MNTNIKERMFEFIEYKHLTPTDFARQIGVSRSYAHNVFKTISSEVLLKIKKNFPELNLEWLLIGSGEMNERKRQEQQTAEVEQLKTEIEQLKQKINLLEELNALYKERENARKKNA